PKGRVSDRENGGRHFIPRNTKGVGCPTPFGNDRTLVRAYCRNAPLGEPQYVPGTVPLMAMSTRFTQAEPFGYSLVPGQSGLSAWLPPAAVSHSASQPHTVTPSVEQRPDPSLQTCWTLSPTHAPSQALLIDAMALPSTLAMQSEVTISFGVGGVQE